MDLKPDQVKHNLAFYRTRRKQLNLEPRLYADLGSFPTQIMAEARVEQVKDKFAADIEGLVIDNKPDVTEIGGTPVFTVHITGFAKADKVKAFCDKLKKESLPCKPHGG
jgi:hypothetical protein